MVAANKWDLVKHEDRVDAGFLKKLQEPILVCSRRAGVDALSHRTAQPEARDAGGTRGRRRARLHIPTPALNTLIRNALDEHPPRTHKGRRLKILYATQARSPVPTIVLSSTTPS